MRRFYASASLLVALHVSTAAVLAAQSTRQPLFAGVDAKENYRADIRLGPVLVDRELQDAAMSGLPVRVRVKTELWHDGFLDALERATTWGAVLVYEPLRERFLVRSIDATGPARSFATYDLARAAIEGSLPVRLQPTKPGKYYYTATLEIETLSVSDLQELERWLQGQLEPAVSGNQSIPGAIGSGAKRLLIHVLGVPNRRLETRSPRFTIPD